MAAKSGRLEDHITCSICFEIYREPHALPCLHSFCHQCIVKIDEESTVQCPECREFTNIKAIKRDFKTQALLDYHKRSSNCERESGQEEEREGSNGGTSTTSYEDIVTIRREIPRSCEMCGDKSTPSNGKPISSKCRECDQFMCQNCDVIHQNIKTCKNHTVTPVQHFIQTLHQNIKCKVNQLQVEFSNLCKNSASLEKSLKTIDGVQKDQLSLVDKHLDKMIQQATDYKLTLHKLIEESNNNLKHTLASRNHNFKINQKELQAKIEHLKEQASNEDLHELMATVRSTDEHIARDIEKIQREIQKSADIFVKSPIKITLGEELNLASFISIKVHDLTKVIYSELTDRNYSLVTTEPLCCSNPRRLRLLNDNQLWMAGYDGIYIYSTDTCQLLNKIKHSKLTNVYSLVQNPKNGTIIAACLASGLHLLDAKGNYVTQIATGKFSDVCYKDEHLYTLDVDTSKVLIFALRQEKDSKSHQQSSEYVPSSAGASSSIEKQEIAADYYSWVQVSDFSISHGKCSHDSRLSAQQQGISISSYNSQSLFLYSPDGNFMYQISSSDRQKLSPLMCDTDNEGNVLIANHQTHKVLVYRYDRTWEELALPEVSHPIDVVMDFKYLFVVNYRQKVLLKFVQK